MTTVIDIPEGGANITRVLTLTDKTVPIDLTNADSVTAVFHDLGNRVANPRNQETQRGKVEVLFTADDMSEPGVFAGTIEIAWDDESTTIIPIIVNIGNNEELLGWATLSQVKLITGAVVTPEDLAIAAGIIELYANRPVTMANNLSARSRRLLKVATAWQAKHVHDNASTIGQPTVVSGSQDGVSFTYAASNNPELHPFTKRALLGLPQYGTHLEPFPAGNRRRGINNFLNEASDDYHPWTQMEGL